MNDVFVLLGIDMETDIGVFTPFLQGVEKGTPLLLKLFEKKGIPATFLWVADIISQFKSLAKEIERCGHENGCHTLQHETLGEPYFDIPLIKPVLSEEVAYRIQKATEIVGDVIGTQPLSFRTTRFWGNEITLNTLNDLGYLADSSYPMYYYQKQLTPYHPSRENWTEIGNLNILEIPTFADLTIESHDEYGRDRDQWPIFRTEGSQVLMNHIENMITYFSKRNLPKVFCFYLHPWEFIEVPSRLTYGEATIEPFPFITKNCGLKALQELSILIDELLQIGGQFYTFQDFTKIWNNRLSNE